MPHRDAGDEQTGERHRVAKHVFHLLLHFCSPERRDYVVGLVPYLGYRHLLRSFPLHIYGGYARRRVTGVFLAVVTLATALTAVLSIATTDLVAGAQSIALGGYAGSLAYFDTGASRLRRAAVLAGGAALLAASSAVAAVLYPDGGAADTALRAGLALQAIGLAGVSAIALTQRFRALRLTTVVAVVGAVVCGVADLAAAQRALQAGHRLEAATLVCVLPLAVIAMLTVPQFDSRADAT